MDEPTLNEALAQRGYTTQPAGFGRKDIIDSHGLVRFTGTAGDVWDWLRKYGHRPAKGAT